MKKDPAVYRNTFTCPHCEGQPQFDQKEFVKHIREVHKIMDNQAQKRMTLHLNCGDQSIYNWEWTIGGLTFYQSVNLPKKEQRI